MTDSPPFPAVRRIAATIAVIGLVLALGATTSLAATGLWNVARIGGPVSADGVVIAVIDTGVDHTHPAFGGRVLPQKDFVGDGKSGDPHGHGTHVAGTAAGGSVNCSSVAGALGVASTARVRPVRVLDAEGKGTMGDVADGIRWAADNGAHVINLSLGPEIAVTNLVTGGGGLVEAIEYAWDKGSIPVLAAGNDQVFGSLGSGYGDVPAVVVTATTRDDRKASYATSVGSARWGIAAPGGDGSGAPDRDIVSAWPNSRCQALAGTSMAAPHVSGTLAALRARGQSPSQAVERLLATADPIEPASTYGAGLVNVGRAVGGLGGAVPPAVPDPAPAAATPADESGPTAAGPTPTAAAPSTTAETSEAPSTTATPSTTAGQDPTTTVADRTEDDDEVATGKSVVRDDDAGGVPVPLAVGAGLAVAALWGFTGRAALRLRP